MNLQAIRFVKRARSTDKDRGMIRFLLLEPKIGAILACNGYVLHAVKSDNKVACVADVNDAGDFIVKGEAQSFGKYETALKAGEVVAHINLNSDFLRPVLNSLEEGQTITISIKKDQIRTYLEVATEIDTDPVYALFCGLSDGNGDNPIYQWRPKVDEAKS